MDINVRMFVNKVIACIFIFLSFPALSDRSRIAGDIESRIEKWVPAGEVYVVPSCRKWLIQDLHKLGPKTWLEIDGVLELSPSTHLHNTASNMISGKFTYWTGSAPAAMLAIIHPEASVKVAGEGGINIVEFTWYEENGLCKG